MTRGAAWQAWVGGLRSLALFLARAAAILVGAWLASAVGSRLVDRALQPSRYLDGARARTLAGIFKSLLRYAVGLASLLTLLSLSHVSLPATVAGAGLIGVALGFGAQSLVRDVIAGFFLVYEDQFRVGEYVAVGDVSGVVEEMGFRVTRLRGPGGQIHVIPNGLIARVTNFSRSDLTLLFEVAVSPEADASVAERALEQLGSGDLMEAGVTAGPRVLGLGDMAEGRAAFVLAARVRPDRRWTAAAAVRRRIREGLANAGIGVVAMRASLAEAPVEGE